MVMGMKSPVELHYILTCSYPEEWVARRATKVRVWQLFNEEGAQAHGKLVALALSDPTRWFLTDCRTV
jgi:hypothetical protein